MLAVVETAPSRETWTAHPLPYCAMIAASGPAASKPHVVLHWRFDARLPQNTPRW